MTKLKVACVQTNTCNDLARNMVEAETYIRQAARDGAELISLPENVFMMRASDKDEVEVVADVDNPAVQMCQKLAQELGVWVLIGSVFAPAAAKRGDGSPKWYNRSLLIDANGRISARYDKVHLFDAELGGGRYYQESARIEAGNSIVVTDTPWGKLGMAVCYDVRFPHMHRTMAQLGAKILSLPAAFAEYTGKAHWHVLLRARAIETGCFVVAPGQCGSHPGEKRTYGYSLIIDPWGEILAEGDAELPGVVMTEIDLAEVDAVRARLPAIHSDREFVQEPEYMI